MEYIKGKNYTFKNCICNNRQGREITIPDGVWQVAELDYVVVYLEDKEYSIDTATFDLLKTQKKAVPCDL